MLYDFNMALWQWILPPILILTAILCAIYMHGRPIVGFGSIIRKIVLGLIRGKNKRQNRAVFCNALGAAMGTGNLVGTALALMTGGPGAIFWMWISALLGIVLSYAENLLGCRFRKILPDGSVRGGALALLHEGLGQTAAAFLFAVCCSAAGLGMGNLAQTGTIAETAAVYGIPRFVSGVVTAMLLLIILGRKRKHASRFLSVFMPLLCLFFLVGCSVMLIHHVDKLPSTIAEILRSALGWKAAGGGFAASALMQSFSVGIRRGIFSNEAGLGTSGMLHAAADTDSEIHPAELAAAEVFFDTFICCSMTALVILCSRPCREGNAAEILLCAFQSGLGDFAGAFLSLSLIMFAFATAVGWFSCGASAFCYLFGSKSEPFYLALWVFTAFAGAFGSPEWIWAFSDCCNGIMALPNLYAILRLMFRNRTVE